MKKLYLLLVLFAAAVGCAERPGTGQHETEQEAEKEIAITHDNIVGEWEATNQATVRTVDGKTTYEKNWTKGEFAGVKRVFRFDGTGSEFNDFNSNRWYEAYIFKWAVVDDKIQFSHKESGSDIVNGGIDIDPVIYFSETDWTVHKLTSKELKVSYTRVISDPEQVAKGLCPDERELSTWTFEKE